jgi:hypothetical protein
MVVPRVVSIEDSQPETVLIYATDHDVAVLLVHSRALSTKIDHFEGAMSHRLIPVRLSAEG